MAHRFLNRKGWRWQGWKSAGNMASAGRVLTRALSRTITREADEAVMEAMAARVAAHPEKMRLRKQLCEHPFGTLKRWFGYSYFLLKGLEKVRCEWNLMTLAYNFKRVLNLVRFDKLMAAVGVKVPQSA